MEEGSSSKEPGGQNNMSSIKMNESAEDKGRKDRENVQEATHLSIFLH